MEENMLDINGQASSSPNKHRRLSSPDPTDPHSIARCYQLEALEMAIKQNTIVYLETGSGKTLIAVMLLKTFAHSVRKPGDSIAVFLVPTVVLVKQQAEVIEMHTDLKVGTFYGEMQVDYWDRKTWINQLERYEVFVMTPQILLNIMRHSFFRLEKIKLLIFDECHHARKKHPYACIMTEFYHPQLKSNPTQLPRIFGMTASLVNTKGSSERSVYVGEIAEIESLMHSKVYTVVSESVLAKYVPFSTTSILEYNHDEMPNDLFTLLSGLLEELMLKHLQSLQGQMLGTGEQSRTRKNIKKLHGTLLFCLKELGLLAAVKASDSLSRKENTIVFWGENTDGKCDNIVRQFSHDVLKAMSGYLLDRGCINHHWNKIGDPTYLVSSKVRFLVNLISKYRTTHSLRCIIFVERVITAMVVKLLLHDIEDLQSLGIEYMAGSNSHLQSQTRSEQFSIVNAFQDGKVKIIIATQILEEGLDVQSCNLVIRFDQPSNVCSFIQSRGRARMKDSEYLLIIKGGDTAARANVTNYLNSGCIMREESLRQASLPCKPLKCEIYDEEFYCVESTGAKATLSSSVSLIHFYCSRLPSDGYFKPQPRFVIDKDSNICSLYMPKSCPVQSISVEGDYKLKEIASLEIIKKLHQIGALSDNLIPISDDKSEFDSGESGFEYNSEQISYYPGKLVDSWSSYSCYGLYHCYTITLNKQFQSECSFSDVILVVKSDLGLDLISNSFDLEEDRGVVVVNVKYTGRVHLNREQVLMARKYQTCVLNLLLHQNIEQLTDAINNSEKNKTCTDAVYLILPSVRGKIDLRFVQTNIFSATVGAKSRNRNCCTCKSGHTRLIQTIDGSFCHCVLQNSVVYTPHNGYFYCVKGFLNTLNSNSTLELKGGETLTYKAYFKTKHGIDLKWTNQSLLNGRHMFTVQNFLSRRRTKHKKENSSAGVELPPEVCKIVMSPISNDVLYSFSFVPSIMHRIESLLLASELKLINSDLCMQNVNVSTTKVLEAITTKKCQEAFSLESLETLGDSFLKYATSQHLFKLNEHHHQGMLTSKRERLISNANLCQIGCTRHLSGFILNEQFSIKKWIVPGSCHKFEADSTNQFMSQNNLFNAGVRNIKSKVVADFVEALIGAYLISSGENAAFSLLKMLGVEVIYNHEEMNIGRSITQNVESFVNVMELEHMLNYRFNDPSLLLEALTHGSYQVSSIPKCYQRLEFLGDAVLDHLITLYLYYEYPEASPGLITDLRSASVNNDCYAHAAAKAGLNKHVLHASSDLHKQMTYYLQNFTTLFSGSSHGWEAGIALPKVLADVIESIAGAIYIDSNSNKETVWHSIRPLLEPMVTPETMVHNPLRELNELCSQKSYTLRFSKSSKNSVASITVEVEADEVVYSAKSTASDKKSAKKKAAKEMLQILKSVGR